ncbi:PH domain-containing protein [Paenibacillus sp. Marseille-Q4541]|uniref:PH domain-containing protein n=1 Tax=Paenibacillus sp. Marseille-Q4541 TaxID=2831522 RepID=UPI001BA90A4A|nr:PH domain-containing protein [Paenibacillus sp. Marseille-Q4541]
MSKPQRYHPLTMLLELWNVFKSSISIIIFLFIIQVNSNSNFITYGRYAFYAAIVITLIVILWKWLTSEYLLDDAAFHLQHGMLTKTKKTIPFSKIQNVQRHSSYFHRIFNVTSIRFETGMKGDDAAVVFRVLTKAEANSLEQHLHQSLTSKTVRDHDDPSSQDLASSEILWTGQSNLGQDEQTANVTGNVIEEQHHENIGLMSHGEVDHGKKKTIHYTSTKKELFKASFISLSFFVLIPIVGSIYSFIKDWINIEEEAESVFSNVIQSWWLITIVILGLLVISAGLGIVTTFLKYGKYEISSDEDRIYISKGLVEQSTFSISKEKVQAIDISQSFLKRCMGLAEVKLTTVSLTGDTSKEVNSLYPFLPVKEAYSLISELLPSYRVIEEMEKLPRKSLWIRMFRPSWLWIIVTVALYYIDPSLFGYDLSWWILSVVLLIWIYLWRILDFWNTRYVMDEEFIQLRSGGFGTHLFISKRDKIIEVKVTRGYVQRLYGVATIHTLNRPALSQEIKDVPLKSAGHFYSWYVKRGENIKTE